MLPPDQWDSILGSVTGTIVHSTERVSSNRLMDLLGVENVLTRRREVGKSVEDCQASADDLRGGRAGGRRTGHGRRQSTDQNAIGRR